MSVSQTITNLIETTSICFAQEFVKLSLIIWDNKVLLWINWLVVKSWLNIHLLSGNEPTRMREKTNNLGSDQVRHKPVVQSQKKVRSMKFRI